MGKSNRAKGSNVIADFQRSERRKNLIFGGVLTLIVVSIIGGAVLFTQSQKVDKATEVVAPEGARENYSILLTAEDLGGEAPASEVPLITLSEDFSCPACKSFEEAANETLLNLVETGQAEIEYQMVGFLDDLGVVNDHSKRAASAAFCVRETDGMAGWKEYHDWLYENQPIEGQEGQSNNEFLSAAEDLGLSPDPACVRSEKYVPWMVEATEAWPYDSTPTVLVEGEEVEADPLSIVQAVDAAAGKFEEN